MGKMKNLALDLQEQIENEWYEEQRALLLSQGHTAEEVDEIIEEMINEYQQEEALDRAMKEEVDKDHLFWEKCKYHEELMEELFHSKGLTDHDTPQAIAIFE